MDNKHKLHGAFSWCELLTTDVPEAKCPESQVLQENTHAGSVVCRANHWRIF